MRQAAETLAAPLPALQAEAEQVANTVAYGVHGRRKVGAGETFWQFRRYQPGDMRSTIDWRKSAKSEHLFIREHEWEAADTVWLWRDGAPSTNYRSTFAPVTKWHRASVITIALASLLVRGGERIAALESTSPPASGRAALREFAHTLSIPDFGQSGFPDVRHLPRHAKVVLVSDFFHPYEEIASLLTNLTSAGITGHLMQVIDPSEEDFPFEGRIQFENAEHTQQMTFDRSQDLRGDYRREFIAHREAISDRARKLGWTFAHHRTDSPPEAALLALFHALSAQIDAQKAGGL